MNESTAAGRPYLWNTTFNPRLRVMVCCSLVLLVLLGLGGCNEPEPTPTPAPTAVAAISAAEPLASASSTPTLTQTLTPVMVESEATGTATATMTATGCPAPEGWVVYTVALGDTLSRLGAASGASVAELMQANCLEDDAIYEGQTLHLPAAPPPTATPTPEPTRCGAPAGWVVYVVQPGDTLSGLAGAVGAAVEDIRLANCLPDDTIYAGRGLRLPRLPGGTNASAGGAAPVTVAEAPDRIPSAPNCVGFACASAQPQDPPIYFNSGLPAGGNLCSDAGGEISVSIGRRNAFGQVRVQPTATLAPDGTITYRVGKEFVFGACNVGVDKPVMFTLSENGGPPASLPATTVDIVGMPVPSATWWAGCEEVGRRYTVSFITESTGVKRERTFDLTTPIDWAVFFRPLGGRRYQVDFCYETLHDNTIELRLFHGKLEDGRCKATAYWDGQTMATNTATASGFYIVDLPLPRVKGDCYVLRDETTRLEARAVIPVLVDDGQ